jgi:hypothetical protein
VASRWQVRLKNTSGALVAILTNHIGFNFQQRVNRTGSYAIRIPGELSPGVPNPAIDLFDVDYQVEFWRSDQDAGIDWYREFAGFHRSPHYYTNEDGQVFWESLGRGYADLLNRRIVYAEAESDGASKEGAAETIAKAYVDENAGPAAGARAFPGFTVEADSATGNTIAFACAYKNLLGVIQDIADIGGGDFAVVPGAAPATFEFKWYDGQLGTDRSGTLVFSQGRGNLKLPDLRSSRLDEVTHVLVGGSGQEEERITIWREDAGRGSASPWNRIESFVDQRQESTASLLNAAGDAALELGRPKNTFQAEVIQIPGYYYGKDYFLGDLVTTVAFGHTAVKRVQGVNISYNPTSDAVEIIQVSLEDIS